MITIEDVDQINIDDLEGPLKRVALIHDLSGFGKASLTVTLPILAAAGIEGICIPTALLSTHTGEFQNFTYLDLTDEIPKILNHWKSFNLIFNAVYSGYLSSAHQVDILISLIEEQKKLNPNLKIFIDPVMGDNGNLYNSYDKSLIHKNRELIKEANVIFPNMTESYLLLDEQFKNGPYSENEVERVAQKLFKLCQASVVITGIELDGEEIGIAVLDNNKFSFIKNPKLSGKFHGTGDTFASFTIGAYLNNIPLLDSVKLAGVLVYYASKRTAKRDQPRREGLDFESVLPLYIHELQIYEY